MGMGSAIIYIQGSAWSIVPGVQILTPLLTGCGKYPHTGDKKNPNKPSIKDTRFLPEWKLSDYEIIVLLNNISGPPPSNGDFPSRVQVQDQRHIPSLSTKEYNLS